MSTPTISATAAANRETARTTTGQFGEQLRGEDAAFAAPAGTAPDPRINAAIVHMEQYGDSIEEYPGYEDDEDGAGVMKVASTLDLMNGRGADADGNGDGFGFRYGTENGEYGSVEGLYFGVTGRNKAGKEIRLSTEFIDRRYCTADREAEPGRDAAAATVAELNEIRDGLIADARDLGLVPYAAPAAADPSPAQLEAAAAAALQQEAVDAQRQELLSVCNNQGRWWKRFTTERSPEDIKNDTVNVLVPRAAKSGKGSKAGNDSIPFQFSAVAEFIDNHGALDAREVQRWNRDRSPVPLTEHEERNALFTRHKLVAMVTEENLPDGAKLSSFTNRGGADPDTTHVTFPSGRGWMFRSDFVAPFLDPDGRVNLDKIKVWQSLQD